MTEHIANPIVDSRARMVAPLVVFFVACFLFAGAVKFHVLGGDLWFARPMGAPVTCLFLVFVGFHAARWFCGTRPTAVGAKVLAALVLMLPLMGLLGVVQLATGDKAAISDPTPLGGTLGAMLAGPRAFGSLGPTVAGILFAILALFGGYLARRIIAPAASARAEDPYAALKAVSPQRMGSAGTDDGGVAVLEDDPAGIERPVRGELFPADAELEPEPSVVVTAEEERSALYEEPAVEEEEVAPAPVRTSILAGLVDDTETMDDGRDGAMTAAQLLAPTLEAGPDEEDEGTMLRPPSLDPDEEPSVEADDEGDDETEPEASTPIAEDPEMVAIGGEAPELRPEWLAAPSAFHRPRLMQGEIEANEALEDVLDVQREPSPAPEEDAPADEPEAAPERPRFRVKAEYIREEPIEAPDDDEPDHIESNPLLRSASGTPDAEPASEAAERASEVQEEVPELVPFVEAQLGLPAMPELPAPPPGEASDADSPRPRRRMRSAAKDWASWDDAQGGRPRLRLVKSDEPSAAEPEMPAASGDAVYDRAVALVVEEDRCSVSLLQRNLGVTFGDATALIDRMYQQGVVGPYQPTGRRDVLLGKKRAAAAEDA